MNVSFAKRVLVSLLLVAAVSVMSFGQTSGDPETMVFNDISGALEPFAAPGQTFVVAQAVRVYDPGDDGAPTAIETISLCLATSSTLESKYIAAIRLYVDDTLSGYFDRRESTLLGSVIRPDLENCETFGQAGKLFMLVPNKSVKLFFVVVDLASDAPDSASLILRFDVAAQDGLLGGPAVSSGFSSEQGPPVIGNALTVRATSGDAETDVVDETQSVIAKPGTSIVVQQFSIADPGSDGDTEDDDLATLVRSITVQAVDTTIDLSPRAGLIKRVRLFRESGRTGPGWQEGDELLSEVLRPNLEAGVTFGNGGRRLVRVGRNNIFGTGGVERFYIVVDLAPSGFANGLEENRLRTQVTVAARDDGGEDAEESSGIETPMPVIADGWIEIVTGAPKLIVNSTGLSTGKIVLSIENVPLPGLGDLEATLTFDPFVIQVRQDPTSSDENPRYKVRALGSYALDELTVDNEVGQISFVLSLRPGRKAATDSDILEIEIIPGNDASLCQSTDLELISVFMTSESGMPLEPDLVVGQARLELKAGDVTLDGVVNRRDARAAARLVGKTLDDFPSDERQMRRLQFMAADVASLFGEITATDVRWIKEAVVGRRTLPESACDNTAWQSSLPHSQPLSDAERDAEGGVRSLASVNARVQGRVLEFVAQGSGIAEATVELFTLAGAHVLTATAPGPRVTLSLSDHRLANGVYLYAVTVRGWDGQERRGEVRKLVVLR